MNILIETESSYQSVLLPHCASLRVKDTVPQHYQGPLSVIGDRVRLFWHLIFRLAGILKGTERGCLFSGDRSHLHISVDNRGAYACVVCVPGSHTFGAQRGASGGFKENFGIIHCSGLRGESALMFFGVESV